MCPFKEHQAGGCVVVVVVGHTHGEGRRQHAMQHVEPSSAPQLFFLEEALDEAVNLPGELLTSCE